MKCDDYAYVQLYLHCYARVVSCADAANQDNTLTNNVKLNHSLCISVSPFNTMQHEIKWIIMLQFDISHYSLKSNS